MSTPSPSPGVPQPAPAVHEPPRQRQIVIIGHSTLFYWWPVWAVGFLMWLITLATYEYMVTVPPGTKAVHNGTIDEKGKPRDILIVPAGASLPALDPKKPEELRDPYMLMSPDKSLGVIFMVVLMIVITITNVPLRGLWSVIVIVILVALVIIFAILRVWETIFHYLHFLDVRINAAGYFWLSAVLFVLWLVVIWLFDQQIYMIFEPGQMRVRQEIGDAETAFDTTGMTIQKQRSDLFRHWILGLGSGDLIVKTAGAHPQEFQMNNVLFIGRKVREIEDMLRSRQVITGQLPQ
jgi:hypothetical protein